MIMLKKSVRLPNGFCVKNRRFLPDLQKSVQLLLQQSIKSQAATVFIVSDFTDFSDDMQKKVWRLWLKSASLCLKCV